MQLIVFEYTYEGVHKSFIFDLHNVDQMDRMNRTLVWAAKNGVVVTIRGTKVAARTEAA